MGEPASHDPFLLAFTAPAARCDASGLVLAHNGAFEAWAGYAIGSRVDIRGPLGTLFAPNLPACHLVMSPLADGTWLALGSSVESPDVLAAITAAIALRMGRVEATLEANARIGLQEAPTEPVARCLRETLAAAEELRAIRLQIAALGASNTSQRVPVGLDLLVRDAAAALHPLLIVVEAGDVDHTVEVDRARLFPILVGLLAELAAAAPAGEPLRAELRGGDHVRLRLLVSTLPTSDTSAIASARRFVTSAGGRVLIEPGAAMTLELPAFARSFCTGVGCGTVLIVDDDESTLAMMGAVLRRSGFRVLAAEDGVAASALFRLHASEIVAIVADAVLPGRSGLELAAEARRSVPAVPVLLVSGHSSDLLGTYDLCDLPILSKPFGARVLADRVRDLLDHAETRA